MANSGEIVVFRYDIDRRYTFVNRMVLELWNLTESVVLGKRMDDLFTAFEPEQFIRAFENQESGVLESETKIEGAHYYFRCFFTPLFDEHGNFKGMLEQRTNITEQREAEKLLRASENKYRYLANSGEAYITVFGVDKRCTYVNELICTYTGYSEKELLGQYVDIFMDENA